MFQQFFTNTIESKFIKELLFKTPLPHILSVKTNDYIYSGNQYVYMNMVIECTKSGKIGSTATYKPVRNFMFGDLDPSFTERYFSNNSFYDSETHMHLGQYLRYLKNLYGLDLMPFYNCYANQQFENLNISYSVQQSGISYNISDNRNEKHKNLLVPILYNKVYTIAYDTPNEVIVMPVFISNGKLVNVLDNNKSIQNLTENMRNKITKYERLSFKQPITFSLSLDESSNLYPYYRDNEPNLYLLLQVSKNDKSSLVVLEGDYTGYELRHKYTSITSSSEVSIDQANDVFLSRLSLLKLNDHNTYAFSDRLIEYLTLNVVSHTDDISYNITELQKGLGVHGDDNMYEGVWSDYLRYLCFKLINSESIEHVDMNGFLDKDSEFKIL